MFRVDPRCSLLVGRRPIGCHRKNPVAESKCASLIIPTEDLSSGLLRMSYAQKLKLPNSNYTTPLEDSYSSSYIGCLSFRGPIPPAPAPEVAPPLECSECGSRAIRSPFSNVYLVRSSGPRIHSVCLCLVLFHGLSLTFIYIYF